mgnify:CR=1 FL=1
MELTPEEKQFVVNLLQQAQFGGNREELRKALERVDAIIAKLTEPVTEVNNG